MNSYEEKLKKNRDLFPELHTILLFGSAVNHFFHKESDIDLAIGSLNPLSDWDILQLKERFSMLLENREIDLINLDSTEGLLHREIFTKGRVVKEDPNYYLRKLSDMYDYMELYYPLLKEDRLKRVKDTFFR